MVDYEERDTKRGLREFEKKDEAASSEAEDDDSGPMDDDPMAEDDDPGDGGADDGVVDIDVIRQELEIRPDPDPERETSGDDSNSHGRDEHGTDEHGRDEHGRDEHGRDEHGHQRGQEEHKQGRTGNDQAESDHEQAGSADRSDHDRGDQGHADHDHEHGHADHDHEHGHADHDHEHGHADHEHHTHDVETLRAAVMTVSSTRTMDDDPSGEYLVSALLEAGHEVVSRELIGDDREGIQHTVEALVGRSDVDLVIITGGTGVTPDDQTVEAVGPLFEKELPGFGELFRALSYEEIGARTVATRATAGVVEGVPVFCLPGSRNAVELGADEIILEVAPHVAGLATRDGDA